MDSPLNVEQLMERRRARQAKARLEERAAAATEGTRTAVRRISLSAGIASGLAALFVLLAIDWTYDFLADGLVFDLTRSFIFISVALGATMTLIVWTLAAQALKEEDPILVTAQRFYALDMAGRNRATALIAEMSAADREAGR